MLQEDSLDLGTLEVDPDAPSIWFSTQASVSGRQLGSRSVGSTAMGSIRRGQAEMQSEQLAAKSPFYTAGGASAANNGGCEGADDDSEPTEGMMHAAAVEAAAALTTASAAPGLGNGAKDASKPSGSANVQHDSVSLPPAAQPCDSILPLPQPHNPVPPADDVAAAAVATAAAAAAGISGPLTRSAAQDSGGVTNSLGLQRQITVRFPVVITPSEHVEDFRGSLPAAALADIYAGEAHRCSAWVCRTCALCSLSMKGYSRALHLG